MATYDYSCIHCDSDFEARVPAAERDQVMCASCGNRAQRQLTFNGVVWAPTAGGMR